MYPIAIDVTLRCLFKTTEKWTHFIGDCIKSLHENTLWYSAISLTVPVDLCHWIVSVDQTASVVVPFVLCIGFVFL